MNESKDKLEGTGMGLSLYISFSLILFAGLILGSTLVPWGLVGLPLAGIAVLGVSLFVFGFLIQRRREIKIGKKTNERFSELEKRVKKLEEQHNTKQDNRAE